MAHSNNIISSIKLPNGVTYEIHDAQAIHAIEDLGLGTALIFKGVKETKADLPTSGNKVGDVWHVKADDYEYVWAMINGTTGSWEEFGAPHDYASSTHKHTVTVAGSNEASTVTGSVTVPRIEASSKYVKATVSRGQVSTDTVLGTGATFTTSVTPNTTNIKATASGTAVGANGTANAITGFGTHTTDTALGTNATFAVSGGAASTSKMVTTTVKNPTVTDISIPNVTGNIQVTIPNVTSVGSRTPGSAADWEADVTDGVLTFTWTPNVPTVVTMPTLGTALKATNTTLGTAIDASRVTTSNVTVATGALSSSGSGADVATGISEITVAVSDTDAVEAITALGTPTTAAALTGVKVTAQPTIALATGATAGTGVISVATGIKSAATSVSSADTVTAITAVPVPTVTLSKDETSTDGIALVDTVQIGTQTATVTGTATAQKWTQGTTTVSVPN